VICEATSEIVSYLEQTDRDKKKNFRVATSIKLIQGYSRVSHCDTGTKRLANRAQKDKY
jgi:hypothetical protein